MIDAPWAIAAGSDLAFPGVQGRRTARTRLVNRYMARLHAAAEADTTLAGAFIGVVGLVDPPRHLLLPQMTLRVVRGTLRRPAQRRPEPVGRLDLTAPGEYQRARPHDGLADGRGGQERIALGATEAADRPREDGRGPFGIAVRKGDTELRDAVQSALQAVIADGTYDRILARWNLEPLALRTAAVNEGP